MVFEIKEKIALVTGGASGIGFHSAQQLLRNGLKGITLVDVDVEGAKRALRTIEDEFGCNKAIFVKADVTKKDEVEEAFQKTIEKFGYIDILLNNAGILNDANWEKEVEININGVINNLILGVHKYLSKHHQGSDAVILNVSSAAVIITFSEFPVYSGTKHAIIGMTKCWGNETIFQKTRVRVVAVCPGFTDTNLVSDMWRKTLPNSIYEPSKEILQYPFQKTSDLAEEIINILKHASTGTAWITIEGTPTFQYIFPTLESMEKITLTRT